MFRKNKNQEVKKEFTFTEWEKDFGFLQLVLERKKNITKNFLLQTYAQQLHGPTDYLKDEDIAPIISQVVTETLSILSEVYKNFLIEKYFGNLENLTKFITEDVSTDLIVESINTNQKKIFQVLSKKKFDEITNLNNPVKKLENEENQ